MALIAVPKHSGLKLLNQPTASVERIEKQRGKPLLITSAYRSESQQRALIARWNQGGTYNRPPYLYKPAMYPPFPHSTGMVIDVGSNADIAWMLTFGRAHGWRRPFFYDKVHFQYYPGLDKKKPKAKPTDTRKVYYEPTLKRYYLAGLVNGKSYLNNTRFNATRDRWKKKFGMGTPYHLDLAAIKARAGR